MRIENSLFRCLVWGIVILAGSDNVGAWKLAFHLVEIPEIRSDKKVLGTSFNSEERKKGNLQKSMSKIFLSRWANLSGFIPKFWDQVFSHYRSVCINQCVWSTSFYPDALTSGTLLILEKMPPSRVSHFLGWVHRVHLSHVIQLFQSSDPNYLLLLCVYLPDPVLDK